MKILKTLVVAVVVGFAGVSNAALFCKNDLGQSIEWRSGWPKPVLIVFSTDVYKMKPGFDVSADRDIVCFVNSNLYREVMPDAGITGIPYIPGANTVDGNNSTGVIYRGDTARWLIENLPAVSGLPATKSDYFNAKP